MEKYMKAGLYLPKYMAVAMHEVCRQKYEPKIAEKYELHARTQFSVCYWALKIKT